MNTRATNNLEWFVGSNGNYFADHERGRYCISLDPNTPLGPYYSIELNGEGIRFKQLGGSNDLAQAKTMAQRHADTGRA